jgi:hypothetical protein
MVCSFSSTGGHFRPWARRFRRRRVVSVRRRVVCERGRSFSSLGGRLRTWAVVVVPGGLFPYVGASFPYAGGRFRTWAVVCLVGGAGRLSVVEGGRSLSLLNCRVGRSFMC